MSHRSKFEFVDVPVGLHPGSIVIRDIGRGLAPSIPNDAEQTVQTLLRIARTLNEPISHNLPRIYYYSTENVLAQLEHDGATFIGFGAEV